MDANELEQKLLQMLDALADGAKIQRASQAAGMGKKFIFACIRHSEARNPLYSVSWRDEGVRRFSELVPIAQRIGRVKREQYLRGITIDGEVQYVVDPAQIVRFGDDDDAKDMAELAGFPDFPFAHGIDGARIPLLSARHPRPQRQHTPHPHTGRNGTYEKPNSPPRIAVGERSSGADTVGMQNAAGSLPIRDWRPDDPEPPYSRRVRCAAPPPVVNIPTPASPRVRTESPLVADLRRYAAQPPLHPRPIDRNGRPMMPASNSFQPRADDPPEHVTGRPMP
jgi:hypothetical protein